jgi:hypothetical protein
MEIPFAFFQSRNILASLIFRSRSFSPAVTYATDQLTQSLQELTASRVQAAWVPPSAIPEGIPAETFQPSAEIERYLAERREHAARAENVNVGIY